MQFISFINQISQDISFLQNGTAIPVVCPEDNPPILFMASIVSYVKEKGLMLETIDVTDLELNQLFSRLETSFLGMRMSYVVRGLENKEKKVRQQLLTYLSNYHGPHSIVFLCNKIDLPFFSKNKNLVELPEAVTSDMVLPLLTLFKKNSSPAFAKHINRVISQQEELSLDQVYMLISYMQVIGKTDEYGQIIDRVVETEHSLFTLAQHFFAKNSNEFYQLWAQVHQIYPLTFWTVYWSEQLWRAYYVHYYLSKGQPVQAKSISTRLPFSFMQRDWKKSSLKELQAAHQCIYSLDNAYKNNSEADAGLEIFYNKFFLNQF